MTEDEQLQMKLQNASELMRQMIHEKLEKAQSLKKTYTDENESICSTSLALVLMQYEERIQELEERIQYLENQ